tara:strand:- start:59 stop:226 length:168 start_codon:yes stop_codon:yes gene_type:complete
MSVMEGKQQNTVVLPIILAKGLRDDITLLLTELHELKKDKDMNETIDIQIKGGSF